MSLRHRAAGALALAALLLAAGPSRGDSSPSEEVPQVVCRLAPRVLDVSRRPGPLIARIEVFSSDGLTALDPMGIGAGVHVTSVGGTPVPAPSPHEEGIEEDPTARRLQDKADVRSGAPFPNGIREAVISFRHPVDGDPSTRGDGNAGDVLAMLLGVPDGQEAPVCLAGQLEGAWFQCCDTVQVRNRGLRDLPRGLFPAGGEVP